MPSQWTQWLDWLAQHSELSATHIASPTGIWQQLLERLAPLTSRARRQSARPAPVDHPDDPERFTPEWCAGLSGEDLRRELQRSRRRETQAVGVRSLARWWVEHVAPQGHGSPAERPTAGQVAPAGAEPQGGWRMRLSPGAGRDLLALEGVARGVAEEVRFWLEGEACPVPRGVLRVGWRHGWFDEATDREAAQHVLARWAEETGVDRRVLWNGLRQVGEEWCGGEPNCGPCPLQVALPARGPIPLSME